MDFTGHFFLTRIVRTYVLTVLWIVVLTVLWTVVLSVLNSTDSTSGHFFMTCTVCDPLWDFRPYAFFSGRASNPATPCFFFFFSFYESTIFPLPTDEVSAMCDAF